MSNVSEWSTSASSNNATPPTGYLACDGSAVSRATYAALFGAIGTTWGEGDGSTTFNLPDLRGRTTLGSGSGTDLTARTLGDSGGAETHTLTGAQSGTSAHKHNIPARISAEGGSSDSNRVSGANTGGSTFTLNDMSDSAEADADEAHPNMQPWAAVTKIVRF